MAVLTISREIGSGGTYVGTKVAEELGYHYVDKKTIDRVFHQYGFLPFDKVYDSPMSFWEKFDKMRRLTLANLNDVIKALAHHGRAVIIGRGSFAVLKGLSDVFNVRLQAPFSFRLHRFISTVNIENQNEAAQLLEEKDSIRSTFVESTYRTAWDAASSFDLVINTDKVNPDRAAEWLVDILTALDRSTPDQASAAKSLIIEPYLVSAVNGALDCMGRH